MSDATQLARSLWMSESLLSPSFTFALTRRPDLGGLDLKVGASGR